jgi:hypothetical protein
MIIARQAFVTEEEACASDRSCTALSAARWTPEPRIGRAASVISSMTVAVPGEASAYAQPLIAAHRCLGVALTS